jgi:lipopolysaccharide/colanic/teichoic acid biosynthesis glycosyltransferase
VNQSLGLRADFKRVFDLLLAVPLLLMAIPLLGVCALLVVLDSPGNPIFTQTRVGRDARPYTLLKLRTIRRECFGMFPDPDEEIRWGDRRVTRIGHFLRRSKFDELPQLLNVLKGDMSFVGPRPDIVPRQLGKPGGSASRLSVRPGLTGLAQVSGNTWLSWPARMMLDEWYVQRVCFTLDMRILWYTLPILIRGERPSDDPLNLRGSQCGVRDTSPTRGG